MYVRFESTSRDSLSREFHGIFGASFEAQVKYDGHDMWQVSELAHQCAWFNTHLSEPGDLFWITKRSFVSGVCWFRDGAREHIARAHYMAWLLDDLGFTVLVRKARNPGSVIWEDVHQVVASRHLL